MPTESSGPARSAGKTESEKFRELAHEVEADEDEARRDERLTKVAKRTPAPEPEKAE